MIKTSLASHMLRSQHRASSGWRSLYEAFIVEERKRTARYATICINLSQRWPGKSQDRQPPLTSARGGLGCVGAAFWGGDATKHISVKKRGVQ